MISIVPRNVKCMMVDMGFYIDSVEPIIKDIFSEIYQNDIFLEVLCTSTYKDLVLEVSITRALKEVFSLPIVYHESSKPTVGVSAFENLYYSRIRDISESIVFNNVDRSSLAMFDGYEIIPFLRDRQLFLLSYDDTRIYNF